MNGSNTPPIPPMSVRDAALALITAHENTVDATGTDGMNLALDREGEAWAQLDRALAQPERSRPGLLPDVDHALGAIAAMKRGDPIAPEDIRAIVALAETGADELAGFDIRWNADMRAIARWREAHPGNDLVLPDHADLVVWLMDVFDCSFDQPTVAQVENVRARLGAAQLRAPNALTKDARDIVDQLADALRKTSRRAFMAEERARAAEAANVQWERDDAGSSRDLLNDAMNELTRLHDDSGIGEPPTVIAKIKAFLDLADADRASLDRVEARLDAAITATAPAAPRSVDHPQIKAGHAVRADIDGQRFEGVAEQDGRATLKLVGDIPQPVPGVYSSDQGEPIGGKNTADYDRRQMEERINDALTAIVARHAGETIGIDISAEVARFAPGWEFETIRGIGVPPKVVLTRYAPGESE